MCGPQRLIRYHIHTALSLCILLSLDCCQALQQSFGAAFLRGVQNLAEGKKDSLDLVEKN